MDSKREEVQSWETGLGRPKRVVDAQELFAGERELGILHAGALYRLTVTRLGKLILTK